MTPHISAKKGDIAKIVLMPGDPRRAKYITEKYLDNYKLVSEVRNMLMFTGSYKGCEISIAGSGMGCPSIGIYSYELFNMYDVDLIIRMGSAGSYIKELNVFDMVNTKEAMGESNFAKIAAGLDENVLKPGKKIFDIINETAKKNNIRIFEGRVHSSDVFYRNENSLKFANDNKLDCVEMESFALFANAIKSKKQAATILTISDSFITNEKTSPEERQNSFTNMMELALESALNYNKL
ncbi:purine-nucleoside phosphorylase [Spiroplasma endosymbiont of Aspidapion aeneum]|uniref:purine-nucleoside phosphorylase n=1 Tax=Spiroplasma endosymbiont of Aspidapion aeneum TaxID=3066276 RepID=UPI00313A9DE1